MNPQSPATPNQSSGQPIEILISITPERFWKIELDETGTAQTLAVVYLDAQSTQQFTIDTRSRVQWVTKSNEPLPMDFHPVAASADVLRGIASVGVPMSQAEGDMLVGRFMAEVNNPLIQSKAEPIKQHWTDVRTIAVPYVAEKHGVDQLTLGSDAPQTRAKPLPARNHFNAPNGDVYVIQHLAGSIQSVETQTAIDTPDETASIVSHSGIAVQRNFADEDQTVRNMTPREVQELLTDVVALLEPQYPEVATRLIEFEKATLQRAPELSRIHIQQAIDAGMEPFSWRPAPFTVDRAAYLTPGRGDEAYVRQLLPDLAHELGSNQPAINL